MYICDNCGAVFPEPLTVYEKHGLDRPPYEAWQACPECRESGCIDELEPAC